MKILNLYAGIGGNRKLWDSEHKVTAVEHNKEIARIYSDFFPNDDIIVTDAHQYLLVHYKEFDFVWSSPPCPSHSKIREMASKIGKYEPIYPSIELYQEIIFLKHYFKGKWVVENVKSYYEPLIKPQQLQRHYFWANFIISNIDLPSGNIDHLPNKEMAEYYGVDDLSGYKLKTFRKDQAIRNCAHPKLGLHIFNCAFKEKQETLRFHPKVK